MDQLPLALMPFLLMWSERLVRASWQGVIIIAIVWLTCRFLPRIPPQVHGWLWRLAYLKLLIVLVWGTPISLPILPSVDSASSQLHRVNTSTQPKTAEIVEPSTFWQRILTSTTEPNPAAHSLPMSFWPFVGLSSLAAIWLLGVALCGRRLLHNWHACWQLRRSASLLSDRHLEAVYQRLCAMLGIHRPPPILVTDRLSSPALVHGIHPVILFPIQLLKTGSTREHELILAHELAHYQRHDLHWQWLPTGLHLLLFFHPVIWFAHRQYDLAQEIACDARVVLQTRVPAAEYGNLLVAVASRAVAGNPWHHVAMSMVETADALKQRLTALARIPAVVFRPGLSVGVAITLVCTILLIPCHLTSREVTVPDLPLAESSKPARRDINLGEFLQAAFAEQPHLSTNTVEEITEAIIQRSQALRQRNAAAVAAFFADDAYYLSSSRHRPLIGRKAIQENYERWFDSISDVWTENLTGSIQVYDETTLVTSASFDLLQVDKWGRTTRKRLRITVTRVKLQGQWLIVSLHASKMI